MEKIKELGGKKEEKKILHCQLDVSHPSGMVQ